MSPRTILVGVFAAVCGICATVAVNHFRSSRVGTDEIAVVVARTDIEYGVQLTADMLTVVAWPSDKTPPEGFQNVDELVGQYTTSSFVQNEPLIDKKVSASPTFLIIPEGMRAVTIQTRDEASMVGGLIAPRNRVDLVWTVTEKNNVVDAPMTLTLLENIEVLAVGQKTELPGRELDTNKDTKSVTLLVTPEMAEEINLAAKLGSLNLTLRNTGEITNTEPRRKMSIRDLFVEKNQEVAVKAKETAEFKALSKDFDDLKSLVHTEFTRWTQAFEQNKKDNATVKPAEWIINVPNGMRAISIQTPDDSSGVAGLIQPGNRVDVLLTTQKLYSGQNDELDVTTITLLENITVAAVGTNMVSEDDAEPKLQKSITVLVTPEMAQDINLGSEVGTLRLALRGADDDQSTGPRRKINLAELITESRRAALLVNQPAEESAKENPVVKTGQSTIRINRGGVNYDVPVFHKTADSSDAALADSGTK